MSDPDAAQVRTAFHEASHAIVAELLGVRVDVVSIRPGEHHRGITLHASLAVSEGAEILARRRGRSLLARWSCVPYPLFDPAERRRAELSIMVATAGHLGEFLAPEPFTGRFDDTAAEDEEWAVAVAAELTTVQAGWLADAEQDKSPGDDDAAFEMARRIAGDDAAAAFVHHLSLETSRLVFGPLVRSLIPPVADELLRHEAISGEAVREIVQRLTGESLERKEAGTMVRAVAKQKDPSRISEDTPLSRLMICMRGVIWSRAGGCAEGTIVLDTDPRVAEAPEAFRPLSEHLSVSVSADAHG